MLAIRSHLIILSKESNTIRFAFQIDSRAKEECGGANGGGKNISRTTDKVWVKMVNSEPRQTQQRQR